MSTAQSKLPRHNFSRLERKVLVFGAGVFFYHLISAHSSKFNFTVCRRVWRGCDVAHQQLNYVFRDFIFFYSFVLSLSLSLSLLACTPCHFSQLFLQILDTVEWKRFRLHLSVFSFICYNFSNSFSYFICRQYNFVSSSLPLYLSLDFFFSIVFVCSFVSFSILFCMFCFVTFWRWRKTCKW